MSNASFVRSVERFSLSAQELESLHVTAGQRSRFILQRSEGGGVPPKFTYFGLDVSSVSKEEAERLTLGANDTLVGVTELEGAPFLGGVFVYLPYDQDSADKRRFWFISKMLVIDHARATAIVVLAAQNANDEGDRNLGRCGDVLHELIRPFEPSEKRLRDVVFQSNEGKAHPAWPAWTIDVSMDEYVGRIADIQSRIAEGELQQAILSIGLAKSTTTTADSLFDVMRRRNSSPHIFLVRGEQSTLVGASPAMHLRKTGTLLTVETDAGTRRIGNTEEETQAIMQELLGSAKDLEEQRMIVDETVLDLRAIAEGGKVDIPVELEVRKLGSVMHLFTVLEAQIKRELTPIQAVLECFPPSAVTGAPRKSAMKVIEKVEGKPRGPYGGVLGLVGFDGSVDTAIVLRSAWLEGDHITMRCGGGITHASTAADEYNECMNKARSMMDCVRAAEAL